MKIIYVILLFSLLGCFNDKKKTSKKEEIITKEVNRDSIIITPIIIMNDDFFENPFIFKNTINNFLKYYKHNYIIKKTLLNNKIEPSKFDTLISFTSNNTYFTFYKNARYSETNALCEAIIKDSSFVLKKNIFIGLRRSEFEKIFPDIKSTKSDTILLSDQSEMVYYYFYFKANKLNEIVILNNEIDY
jgi:hypothetical protein